MVTREEAKMFFDSDVEVLEKAFESDKEYAEFYKNVLASKRNPNEISDSKEFKIGKHVITGKKIKEILVQYQDSLIDKSERNHNEIVGYTPKIQAVIAKVKSTNELPKELLDFAYENKLPIVMI